MRYNIGDKLINRMPSHEKKFKVVSIVEINENTFTVEYAKNHKETHRLDFLNYFERVDIE